MRPVKATEDVGSTVVGTSRPLAVWFDVGETLVRPRRPYTESLAAVSRPLGVDVPADLPNGLAAHIDVRIADRTQQLLPFTFPADASQQFWFDTYHEFFVEFLSASDARRLAQGLLDLLSSPAGYAAYDDAVPTLERLRADGYRLGVVSNWEAWLPTLLDTAGIASFFDHIVISGVCGIEKPDPRIFTLAMEAGGDRPGEAIYVGDRPAHDVAPAREAGMIPILLDRGDRHPQHDAQARIGTLSELHAVLKELWPDADEASVAVEPDARSGLPAGTC